MTPSEFSNMFDTLLNSYNNLAVFGEASSKADIVLDEYEKSVLLTLALDIIVKLYFQRTNANEGFDDSTRRLMDFSSLITVDELKPLTNLDNYSRTERKNWFNNKDNYSIKISLSEDLINPSTVSLSDTINIDSYTIEDLTVNVPYDVTFKVKSSTGNTATVLTVINEIFTVEFTLEGQDWMKNKGTITTDKTTEGTIKIIPKNAEIVADYHSYDARSYTFKLPPNVLLILNEMAVSGQKKLVVVPINYREYDRLMSKAFAQPLKKQCWRLFQDTSQVDTISELIPVEGTLLDYYKIRYIRRPRPIVLADLNFNDQEPLDIDGCSTVSGCELNPIVHLDILNKAFELAVTTRGARPSNSKKGNED